MAEWQPIETAPRDRDILVFCLDDEPQVVVAYWFEVPEWAGWMYADDALSGLQPEGCEPTHWQPLPEPPHD